MTWWLSMSARLRYDVTIRAASSVPAAAADAGTGSEPRGSPSSSAVNPGVHHVGRVGAVALLMSALEYVISLRHHLDSTSGHDKAVITRSPGHRRGSSCVSDS